MFMCLLLLLSLLQQIKLLPRRRRQSGKEDNRVHVTAKIQLLKKQLHLQKLLRDAETRKLAQMCAKEHTRAQRTAKERLRIEIANKKAFSIAKRPFLFTVKGPRRSRFGSVRKSSLEPPPPSGRTPSWDFQ